MNYVQYCWLVDRCVLEGKKKVAMDANVLAEDWESSGAEALYV